jgi:uncharacterized protein YggT (Ycf19 family)
LTLLATPFFLIYDFVIHCLVWIGNTYTELKKSNPELPNLLNFLKDCLVFYLKGYSLILLLKFTLSWFPNINPFIAPFFVIRVLTEPILHEIETRIPKILGFDLSFLLLSLAIDFSIKYLEKLQF